tara:strand:+ start:846 stop:1310 length:465 start_codon:yes stop_codon:yes gene_type:complete
LIFYGLSISIGMGERTGEAMKSYQITYWKKPPVSVMTYWVHQPVDAESLGRATLFEPPRPGPVGGEGWPVLMVEVDGVKLVFTSLAELDTYVDVMSRKPLPSTRVLSRRFPMGPNSHWLSRLPKKAKSPKHRETAVKYLSEVRGEFAKVAERPG